MTTLSSIAMRLALSLAIPAALSAQTVVRVNVTPSPARVVAGESLQLKAEPVDKDGKPVSGVLVVFQQQDFPFQGTVDSTGLVMAGSVSTIPVVVSAIQPGAKPVITRVEVKVVAGPAATVVVTPAAVKLVPLGLVYSGNLKLNMSSADGTGDQVLFVNVPHAPTAVTRNGVPNATCVYDHVAHTFLVNELSGAGAQWVFTF
jgi:hypothetical protein